VHARLLEPLLLRALDSAPVTYLAGPRQCGKSTLARAITQKHPARYVTFDDVTALAAARSDPVAFVNGLDGPVVLDEVQRAPEILLPLKASVDRDRRAGRFLLTGSANVLALPAIADALVGRVEVLALRPLSQGEIEGHAERFIDALFAGAKLRMDAAPKRALDLPARIARGGFPEVLTRKDAERRAAWFESYVSTLLTRDVRDLANVDGITKLPDLLRLLAARASGLLNTAELARASQLSQTTLKRYFTLLEAVFLVARLPAWSTNLGKRMVKSPKLHLLDAGLAAHLRGELGDGDAAPPSGALLEGFVYAELEKQATWSRTRPRLYHFRSHAGVEVDFLLEDARGQCVGIEVKSGASASSDDFRGLEQLAADIGKRFVRGVVLYRGSEAISFGPKLEALPIEALWRAGAAS
jgi:hypothetical protein